MFNIDDYINLEKITEKYDENKLLDLFFNMNKFINKDKMEEDIKTLKESLMNIAKIYDKKLVFVVDKDKVEMFEAI